MKALLLALALASGRDPAVGDATYDPEVEINMVADHDENGQSMAVCVAYTGSWVVSDIAFSPSRGKVVVKSSYKRLEAYHAIFVVWPFDWNAYHASDGDTRYLEKEFIECTEYFDSNTGGAEFWLNMCADFTKFPELLPKVCR